MTDRKSLKKALIISLIVPFFISCSKKRKIERAIDGWWTIDSIYYENYNLTYCVGDHSLFFRFNDQTNLPIAKNNCSPYINNNYDGVANIQVLNSISPKDTIPFRLKIITNNKIFAGVYKIVFYKDTYNHMLKMELWSGEQYIVCRKGLFNLDTNTEFVDELEKISWTNRPSN